MGESRAPGRGDVQGVGEGRYCPHDCESAPIRLCIVRKTTVSRDGVIRTVHVGFRPRPWSIQESVPPDEMEVAMLLLEPKEEVGKEREAVGGAEVQDAEK